MRRFEAQFEMQPGKPVTTQHSDHGLLGFKFQSSDGRDVAQFRQDGFTYNRLEPYTEWAVVRAEAVRLWRQFVEVANPARIERLALRYINRMTIPTRGNLREYLEVMPPLFPGAPPAISGFVFGRAPTPNRATGANAAVAGALEKGLIAYPADVILDIDVFRVEPMGVEEAGFGPILDSLRTLRRNIFFGSITEENAKRYE